MNGKARPDDLSDRDIRAAANRLSQWSGLTGSERLRGFLDYLIEETIAGRGSEIRAKTIGMDVYGYSADQLADRESVVRVDAGRLRRKIEEYYGGEGAGDAVRIALPKGNYAPVFSAAPAASETRRSPRSKRPGLAPILSIAAAGLVAVIAVSVAWLMIPDGETTATRMGSSSGEERSAIFEVSPVRLQAMNLAEEGRDLIFPAINPNRRRVALLAFDSAIEADDEYFGGYAGAAQVHATGALLTDDPELAGEELERAVAAADQALKLAPAEAWSQSAKAWTDFARRDFEASLARSARAVSLSPDDPHIIEFDALISLFSGDFDRTRDRVERFLGAYSGDSGFVFRNAAGSAHYHRGDYLAAIGSFEATISDGGPIGPVTQAYLMAANHMLGRQRKAEDLARQYETMWPGARIDLVFARLFADPRHAAELADGMRGAGWAPGGPTASR